MCLIFVGVLVERSSVVRLLWSFAVTKFLLSLLLSGLVFYARGIAAGHINSVFPVDASALLIPPNLITGLVMFRLLVPFGLTIAVPILTLHAIRIISWCVNRRIEKTMADFPMFSMLCIAVARVLLLFWFALA